MYIYVCYICIYIYIHSYICMCVYVQATLIVMPFEKAELVDTTGIDEDVDLIQVFVWVYTYIHTYIRTVIHTYRSFIHTQIIHTYIHAWGCWYFVFRFVSENYTCMHTYVRTYNCAYIYNYDTHEDVDLIQSLWQIQLKVMLPRNTPNRNIKILKYLAVQIHVQVWVEIMNLYRGIWVLPSGGFWGCSIFSGICHRSDCTCVYLGLNIHIYIHTYLRTCKQMCIIHTYDRTYKHSNVRIYTCGYIYIYRCTYRYRRRSRYRYVYKDMYVYLYIHIYIYIYMYIYINI